MTAKLQTFDPATDPKTIATALRTDGGVIIEKLVATDLMDAVYEEIHANTQAEDLESKTALWPEGNKTVGGLARISPLFANELLAHPLVLDIADEVLLPMAPMGPTARADSDADERSVISHGLASVAKNDAGGAQLVYQSGNATTGPCCHHYTVGATVLLEKGPGGENQVLHRENAIYQPLAEMVKALPEFILSAMWAGTDFAADNGATRLVPGSHRWPEDRIAREAEIGQAEMSKGSIVLWLSRTLHGAGVNARNDGRIGFFNSYIADWFRQEENQYVTVPPNVAAKLSLSARQLVGYRASPSLGWVKGRDLEDLLAEGDGAPI